MNKFKIIGGTILLFIVLILFVPGRLLVEIFNGVFLGVVLAVTVTYYPLVKRSLKKKEIDTVSLMTGAIVCVWTAQVMGRVISVWWRSFGDLSIVNSVLNAGAIYLAIISGILFIAAPGTKEGHFIYNRRLLINSAVIGGLIALTAIWTQTMTDDITLGHSRRTEPANVVDDVAEAIYNVTGNWNTATTTQRDMARAQALAAINVYNQRGKRCIKTTSEVRDLFQYAKASGK